MKQSTNNLSSVLPSAMKKLFFCGQLLIISLSLPSLFYAGISYNTKSPQQKHMLTNKGKKFLATGKVEETEKTIKYSPAFLQL